MTHRGLSPHAFVYAPLSGKRHSCRFTMTRQCRSGRSAASPNRDFQLQTSRGNKARAVRPPQAASVRSSRRPTSEVGSLLFCCTFAHRFRVSSFRFLVLFVLLRHLPFVMGLGPPSTTIKPNGRKQFQMNLSISMRPRQGESASVWCLGCICFSSIRFEIGNNRYNW